MRVVAGTARGRRLMAPEGTETRPTSDRVREAVFNALFSLGAVDGARVLDLFAGTGAMGIEALSRGAAEAVFVESSRVAIAAIHANLDVAGVADRADVVPTTVERYLAGNPEPADLALIDPPYDYEGWDELLARIDAELVVVESGAEIAVPAGWGTPRVKHYGGTVVTIASTRR